MRPRPTGRLMQAAGLILRLCGEEAAHNTLPTWGSLVGTFFCGADNSWSRPSNLLPADASAVADRVPQPPADYVSERIKNLDPSSIAHEKEKCCQVYMPDYSELICWTEEPELISTVSKKDKKEIIKE